MLSQWNFNNSYLQLPKIFFSKTKPNQFSNLELILKNQKLIDKLSLDRTKFDKFIVTSIADDKKVIPKSGCKIIKLEITRKETIKTNK